MSVKSFKNNFMSCRFVNMYICAFPLLCTTAAKLISSDCLITQRAQEKQEVLVAMAQRECFVPTNTAQWHLAAALLLSGPHCEYADARAFVHVRVSFPAPLMRCFLRLFVFSQTGGWLCTGGSWEISFRGLIKHSPRWPGHRAQMFSKPRWTYASPNIIPARDKTLINVGQITGINKKKHISGSEKHLNWCQISSTASTWRLSREICHLQHYRNCQDRLL